jgi:stalled ribosome alternative rescue factor ArfA
MARSKPHPIRVSAVKAALATPLYRQRVARDRSKYNRNDAKMADQINQHEIFDEPLNRFDAEYGDCDGSFEYAH